MSDAPAKFPCPKCNRILTQSGEITVEDSAAAIPTFQCDECLKTVTLFGVEHESALTFAVKDGQAIDPGEPDGVLRF